ncbi:hypothetical protein IQ244_20235 [Nostoc sp. LEGE 06077]|uniref:hypothetical protein n=1 Tax=Nostoc sp. LEGE 06077 TaxID=915325 RepID=UPI00187EC4FC|nr:hypothetical protein [Nostoc sp. LEGE 06077]MBE9208828.1 hypothetical protein [Nostoc sp. LEGE 06077]
MNSNQDHLLELCRRYLLDLVSALSESLKYPGEPLSELLEGTENRLEVEDYEKLYKLTEIEKVRVLAEIATWMEQGERPTKNL